MRNQLQVFNIEKKKGKESIFREYFDERRVFLYLFYIYRYFWGILHETMQQNLFKNVGLDIEI